METVTAIAIGLLGIAIALCFYRIFRGPTMPDRVVGLDAAGIMTMGIMLLLALRYDEPLYLDLALIVALLSFVGTVSIAKFLLRGKIIDD